MHNLDHQTIIIYSSISKVHAVFHKKKYFIVNGSLMTLYCFVSIDGHTIFPHHVKFNNLMRVHDFEKGGPSAPKLV